MDGEMQGRVRVLTDR